MTRRGLAAGWIQSEKGILLPKTCRQKEGEVRARCPNPSSRFPNLFHLRLEQNLAFIQEKIINPKDSLSCWRRGTAGSQAPGWR